MLFYVFLAYTGTKKYNVAMAENEKDKRKFISEKIVGRPITLKHAGKRILLALLCGLVFGAAAAFSMILINKLSPDHGSENISESVPSGESKDGSYDETPEDETEETGETEETAASPESTQTEPEMSGAEAENSSKEEKMIVEPTENSQEPEGMTMYTSLPFFCGEDEWELRMYVTEGMVIDGELALDDLCRFQIRAVSGEKVYILFDEQVQLGVPASDVWTDTDNQLHIVIRDVRTARYRITDYIYNQENQQFEGRFVMDYDGINYWGEI